MMPAGNVLPLPRRARPRGRPRLQPQPAEVVPFPADAATLRRRDAHLLSRLLEMKEQHGASWAQIREAARLCCAELLAEQARG